MLEPGHEHGEQPIEALGGTDAPHLGDQLVVVPLVEVEVLDRRSRAASRRCCWCRSSGHSGSGWSAMPGPANSISAHFLALVRSRSSIGQGGRTELARRIR